MCLRYPPHPTLALPPSAAAARAGSELRAWPCGASRNGAAAAAPGMRRGGWMTGGLGRAAQRGVPRARALARAPARLPANAPVVRVTLCLVRGGAEERGGRGGGLNRR